MSYIVLNIPHSGTHIPYEYREGILLTDLELTRELKLMTDTDVNEIFQGFTTVSTDISRLICDMERFEDDSEEPMAQLGMGVVYSRTSDGKKFRDNCLTIKNEILERYYRPYHTDLENSVEQKIQTYGKCLIVDCHSYSENLPYIPNKKYADICLGVDTFHTSESVVKYFQSEFIKHGYSVEINNPFKGTIVPLKYYKKDKRVESIMIEINKRIYMENGDIDKSKINRLREIVYSILIKA